MAGTKLSAAEIGKRARALMLAAQYLDENCMDTIPEARLDAIAAARAALSSVGR